jgi:hypothetical protein
MRSTSIAALIVIAACSKGSSGSGSGKPGTFEQLFAGTKAPALVGPLAELQWGMPAEAALPKEAALAAGTLTYQLIVAGKPPGLDRIGVSSTAAADPAFFTAQWGAPYVQRDGLPIWLGAGTRATLHEKTIELARFTPLAELLGTGDWLALETRIPLGPTTAQQLMELGRDELDELSVVYERAADDTMRWLQLSVSVPSALRDTRGKMILDRFGIQGDVPWKGTLGERSVMIDPLGDRWSIVVRVPAVPDAGSGSAGSGSGSAGSGSGSGG